ncbi:MAG: hypothetical protein ABL962_18990 [Fimbriimonadaceae bacterium]
MILPAGTKSARSTLQNGWTDVTPSEKLDFAERESLDVLKATVVVSAFEPLTGAKAKSSTLADCWRNVAVTTRPGPSMTSGHGSIAITRAKPTAPSSGISKKISEPTPSPPSTASTAISQASVSSAISVARP